MRCRRVIILSTITNSLFLNVLLNGNGISNNCVVGINGVMTRRALFNELSKKHRRNLLKQDDV
jgi:hypothetical protein